MITTGTRIAAIAGALLLLGLIIELVRRRRLKEEYSVLWVMTALLLLLFAIWGGLLYNITRLIGAVSESSALYFFALVFVLLVLIQISVRLSNLEKRLTAMIQEVAILGERRPPEPAEDGSPVGEPQSDET